MRKKGIVLVGILTIVLLLCLVGCSDSKKDSATSDKDGDEEIVLTVTVGQGEMGDPLIFDKYEETHPGIKIEVVSTGISDAKLMSMIASGNAPDIIRCLAYDELPSLVQRGLMLPLDEMVSKTGNINLDDMYDVANLCRIDGGERGKGSLYALPKDWSPIGLWINKEAFAEEGIPLPSTTEPMTWDEFAAIAQKLVKINNGAVERHGCIASHSLPTLLEMYLNSYNQSLWLDDYSGTTLNETATKKAVEYFMDLQKTGALASSLYPAYDTIGHTALLEGSVGMSLAGYWYIGSWNGSSKQEEDLDHLMFVPAPVGEKEVSYCTDMTAIGICSQTKHPEEAYELWEYMVASEEAVTARSKIGWGIPASKKYYSTLPKEKTIEIDSLAVFENYQLPTLDITPKLSPYITYSSVTSLFDQYYVPVLYGKAELKDALKIINSEIEVLVQEGKELVGAE